MQITLCLYPRFSNFCLSNALEPMRAANDLSGQSLYSWHIVSPAGTVVTSSSGLRIAPEGPLEAATGAALFLLPSYGAQDFDTALHRAALRRAARRHDVVAGLDMGAWLMASAGLLDGRRATIHWDEYDAFAERFPEVRCAPERVVRDADRWSCGGASTAFDLVLGLIERQHGASLRLEVAGLFMHGEWRGALQTPLTREGRVDAAVALMRRNLSTPLPLRIVAQRAGMSIRHMETLFASHLGATPRQVYQRLRLTEARRLLEQTGLSVGEIAARCGYEDPSALGRAFRHLFGASPSAWRSRRRAGPGSEHPPHGHAGKGDPGAQG